MEYSSVERSRSSYREKCFRPFGCYGNVLDYVTKIPRVKVVHGCCPDVFPPPPRKYGWFTRLLQLQNRPARALVTASRRTGIGSYPCTPAIRDGARMRIINYDRVRTNGENPGVIPGAIPGANLAIIIIIINNV